MTISSIQRGRNDLGIVVEQQQVFAGGGLCAKVVQGAVVEAGALPCEHLQVPVLLLQLFVAAEGGRLPLLLFSMTMISKSS